MNGRFISVSVAAVLLLSVGCRKRSAPVASAAGAPPPTANPDPSAQQLPSVYDAGTPADHKTAEKDRTFKRWTAAFVRGTPADKTKARAEIASQPTEMRTEFEKFCQANGVKTD